MAEDDCKAEYHLTPKGWKSGVSYNFSNRPNDVPPADRVLTIQHREYMRSSWSGTEFIVTELFRSDDAGQVAALEKEFGTFAEWRKKA